MQHYLRDDVTIDRLKQQIRADEAGLVNTYFALTTCETQMLFARLAVMHFQRQGFKVRRVKIMWREGEDRLY